MQLIFKIFMNTKINNIRIIHQDEQLQLNLGKVMQFTLGFCKTTSPRICLICSTQSLAC